MSVYTLTQVLIDSSSLPEYNFEQPYLSIAACYIRANIVHFLKCALCKNLTRKNYETYEKSVECK